MITDQARKTAELTALAKDKSQSAERRMRATRRLLKHTEHSVRAVHTAKQVAREFIGSAEVTAEERRKAADLLEFVISQRDDSNDADDDSEEIPAKVGNDGVIELRDDRTRDQRLADMNIGFDDPIAPRKFLRYFEDKDLLPYGIDLSSATEVFYVDRSEFGTVTTSRVLNPKYLPAYEAWKQKRFNGVTHFVEMARQIVERLRP